MAHNSTFYPSHGGGDRSNRFLLEGLAARGHDCRVVARLAAFGEQARQQHLQDLAERSVSVLSNDNGVVVCQLNGVTIHTLANQPQVRQYFARQIEEFNPDVILCSTDDPAQLLLEAALQAQRARVVYLVRATIAVPFGPDCAFPSAAKTGTLRYVDATVGVSEYVASYVRQWSGIPAVHVPISLMEPGPYPLLGSPDNEFVTMANPCAVKGISVVLGMAERMPEVRFAAVPTWGTSEADLDALRRQGNITILPPVDRMQDLLRRTRVFLVPSLWAEARSRLVLESMLCGIPVMASDVGGLSEAMMGVPYLLPVNPIVHYHSQVDAQMVPVADVPPQDVSPWVQTLRSLLEDPQHYRAVSALSHQTAAAYVERLTAEPLEKLMQEVIRQPRRDRTRLAEKPKSAATGLEALSPEKRTLLALRLRQRASQTSTETDANKAWLPQLRTGNVTLRLFCLPHAGGGTLPLREWPQHLPEQVNVCPVRLPGRETRAAEPPIDSMQALVEALLTVVRPHLETPFALFGHSMGAAIAFELTRRLRSEGLPMPRLLLVSGARAPQFRLNHVPGPEPSDEDLLQQIDQLEGTPDTLLRDESFRRLVLPALRADARLYRHYRYEPGEPLSLPIVAYLGEQDPNIAPAQAEAWQEQTTSTFRLRLFTGGHFYLQSNPSPFLTALREDIEPFV